MLAPKLSPKSEPLALVVFDDEPRSAALARSLRTSGWRTFLIDSPCADAASLGGLGADVVVLDLRKDALAIVRALVELSRRADAPPTVVLAERDAIWVAARFNLIAVAPDAPADTVFAAIERARREGRRPRAPK